MEGKPQTNSTETKMENNEPLGLKESVTEFLKSKGVDTEVFKPVVNITDKGYLSVEIYKDGKSVFNGYSASEPFSVGKEKIIEGAKEAVGYWVDSQAPVMEDMNAIREDIHKQLELVKANMDNQDQKAA